MIIIVSYLLFLVIFFAGAYFHEMDIVRTCKKEGRSSQATWGDTELTCFVSKGVESVKK
jgi:hypothetical protein